jgi:hypothetical protein
MNESTFSAGLLPIMKFPMRNKEIIDVPEFFLNILGTGLPIMQ